MPQCRQLTVEAKQRARDLTVRQHDKPDAGKLDRNTLLPLPLQPGAHTDGRFSSIRQVNQLDKYTNIV
jgi:hypothetical protein